MLGNGKGLFGSNPMAMQAEQPMTKPREGPSRTQGILGILGDMLSTGGGGQANYMPQLMQQRQMEQMQGYRTQQAKQQRDGAMQDWRAQQDYARANPEPVEPTALQRNYEWLQSTNPAIASDYLAAQARDPNDDLVTVPIPGRGTYVGPRSGLSQAFGQGGAASPPDRLPADFDFGQPAQGMSAPSNSAIPPPPSGAAPTAISRQEYNALVSDSSQSAVDAYLARRGIRVGGN